MRERAGAEPLWLWRGYRSVRTRGWCGGGVFSFSPRLSGRMPEVRLWSEPDGAPDCFERRNRGSQIAAGQSSFPERHRSGLDDSQTHGGWGRGISFF